MLIRVRSRHGTWRVDIDDANTIGDVKQKIYSQHKISVDNQTLTSDQQGEAIFETSTTLVELGVKHGDMRYLSVSEENTSSSPAPAVAAPTADGSIESGSGANHVVNRYLRVS
jgi:hypothetical protein